jgi:Na+/proline symporter
VFGTREPFGEHSLALATAVGLAIVLAYSLAGGMVAGAWTDLIQGVLMVVAAVAVFVGALAAGGGWGRILDSIAGSERFGPEFLDPLGTLPPLTVFGFLFVFGVGVLGQPHMLHKLFMLRDPARLRWLPLVLGGSQSVCLLLWLGVGLAVPALVAQGRLAPLANPDDATPAFVLGFLPEALAGLVFAALLAAIMSTADSLLNLGAAALARDLPRALRLRRPPGTSPGGPVRDELAAGRIATVVLAIAAGLCAWLYDDLIALLGTFAFGTFAAALTPALAIGLNWKLVPAAAASASIATGLVLNLGLELLAQQTAWPALRPPLAAGALPSAVALAGSFTVLFAVTGWHRLRRRPAPPIAADVAAVMDA